MSSNFRLSKAIEVRSETRGMFNVGRSHAYWIILSAVLLSACGGGGGGGGGATDTPSNTGKAFAVKQYAPADASKPTMVAVNGPRTFQYWEKTLATGDNTTTEALYADSKTRKRAFFDDDSRPIRVVDETTGEYVVVTYSLDRTDFLAYDPQGRYVDGMAIVVKNGKYFWAKIKGAPSLSGQISGDLAGPLVGSFAAVATPGNDLDVLNALPENFNTYVSGVNAQKASPAAVQPQLLRQIQTGGLIMWLGAAAVASVCTVGCPPAALLGASVVGLGLIVAPEVFKGGFNKAYDFGSNVLDDISSDKTFLESIQETYQSIFDSASLSPSSAISVSRQAGDSSRDSFEAFSDPSLLQQPVDGPARIPASVDGYAVDSGSNTYAMSGSIDSSGNVNLVGNNPQRGNLSINGTLNGSDFSGSYSSTQGNGSVVGTSSAIGQCQTQQASGGQGTFTKAYSMGATNGLVDFSYEAFQIPDAFTLQTAGLVAFSTGGLVSGNGATSIPLAGSSVVFVSVSAPQSGTAWEYSMGCPR